MVIWVCTVNKHLFYTVIVAVVLSGKDKYAQEVPNVRLWRVGGAKLIWTRIENKSRLLTWGETSCVIIALFILKHSTTEMVWT